MEVAGAQTVTLAVLTVSTGTATAIDLTRRRIPNTLTITTALAGLGLAAWGASSVSIGAALGGLLLGLALMLPGHVLGATGAGDVKLFAATGTLLGAGRMFEAFLFVAIAGGVLALATACVRGRVTRTLAGTARLCRRPSEASGRIESPAENNRFPYGPAIAAGCVLAALS
jgi:prepilin peptidase CpaA